MTRRRLRVGVDELLWTGDGVLLQEAGGGRRAAGGGRRGGSSDESFAQAILRQRKRSWATEMLSTNCIRRTRCVRPSFGWAHGRARDRA